jgi:hypothetical protein
MRSVFIITVLDVVAVMFDVIASKTEFHWNNWNVSYDNNNNKKTQKYKVVGSKEKRHSNFIVSLRSVHLVVKKCMAIMLCLYVKQEKCREYGEKQV